MLKLNPHISVDCVIFGFDGLNLRILLVKRDFKENKNIFTDFKLPGDLIRDNEDLQAAAERILKELTGLDNIYLHQFAVFGSPERISKQKDIEWLRKTSGLQVDRVVTIAWYSLIKIDESKEELARENQASWVIPSTFSDLAFDHYEIVQAAFQTLREKIKYEPLGFELLTKKFTLRQIQNLYEAILGRKLDNRNFRKKVLKSGYLVPLDEKQIKVAHKPARLFPFDKKKFEKNRRDSPGFLF